MINTKKEAQIFHYSVFTNENYFCQRRTINQADTGTCWPLNLMEKILCNVMNNILHNISRVNSAMGFIGFSIYLDSVMPKESISPRWPTSFWWSNLIPGWILGYFRNGFRNYFSFRKSFINTVFHIKLLIIIKSE